MCLSVSHNVYLEARPVNDDHEKIVKRLSTDADSLLESAECIDEEKVIISDFLALATQCTRRSFKIILAGSRKLKSSVYYKILTRTTQPAHVVSILLVLFVSYNLWPELHNHHRHSNDSKGKSPLVTFIYLGSLAAHFGAQIWMTFVSGLALYFSLPRHTFGMCQEVLFPKYFLLNTILSTMTLITFTKIHADVIEDPRLAIQLIVLSTCLVVEMFIYLYLTPPLLVNMRAKYQYEMGVGNGKEVGYQMNVPELDCPEYKEVHKKFRKIHVKCAIGNIITICATFMHLQYVASKISLSL